MFFKFFDWSSVHPWTTHDIIQENAMIVGLWGKSKCYKYENSERKKKWIVSKGVHLSSTTFQVILYRSVAINALFSYMLLCVLNRVSALSMELVLDFSVSSPFPNIGFPWPSSHVLHTVYNTKCQSNMIWKDLIFHIVKIFMTFPESGTISLNFKSIQVFK